MFASAHDVVIQANGVPIGAARTVTVNQDFGPEPAYVVGTIMPAEIVPQRWSGTVELDKFFIRTNLAGVASNVDVSSEGVLNVTFPNIELIDKSTGNSLLVATNCVIQSVNVNVNANAYVGERATFTATRIVRNSIGTPVLATGLN